MASETTTGLGRGRKRVTVLYEENLTQRINKNEGRENPKSRAYQRLFILSLHCKTQSSI